MARYLVTGGAGFIGGALTRALVAEGHRVVVLDRAARLPRAPVDSAISVVAGDVADPRTYETLTRTGRFDAVLHLAAQTSARVSHESPIEDVESNVRGTLLLADWCRCEAIPHVVYASSMAVYGDPERMPVDEQAVLAPVSYYGVSKLAGEHYLEVNGRAGLAYTIFRLFNVYGPGQDLTNMKQGMVSIYLAYVLGNQPVTVTGSLERFRDFIYIDDVVDAWLRALATPAARGRVYNLGSGTRTTVRSLITSILCANGHDPAHYPVNIIAGHAGDQHGLVANCSRAASELHWNARVPLDEGIARMTRWARQAGEHSHAAC